MQVEFPTVAELQRKLAEKWASVKNGFEGKINIGIDGNSLKSMKSKIRNALKEEKFEIKLDLTNTLNGISRVQKELNKIDSDLKKHRELKIDFSVKDMDKTLSELLKNSKETNNKITKSAIEASKERKNAYDKEVLSAISGSNKILKAQEQIRNAGKENESKKFTISDDRNGNIHTTTINDDGSRDLKEMDDHAKKQKAIDNQRKADIKEIESYLKRIHSIEKDIASSTGAHKAELEAQKKVENRILEDLKTQYYIKNKVNGLSASSTRDLIRKQKAEMAITEEARKQVQAQNEIASAISRVAQLESKKQSLAKSIASASEEEAKWLRKQYDHHDGIQKKLMQKHSLMDKMSASQKEEFENIRRIGFLERERIKAKEQERQEAQKLATAERERNQAQKKALSEMKGDLREVHKLQLNIAEIVQRNIASGKELTSEESLRLKILRLELAERKKIQDANSKVHSEANNVTSSMKEQLAVEAEILNKEKQRVSEVARLKGEQDQINSKLKEHESITRQIGQLQRDMIFAGMREETVIEGQVNALQAKRNAIIQGLEAENKMTSAMKKEISAIEQAQAEQLKLNRLRQDAREVDRGFNGSQGLIDPYSFYSNARQGAMAVFEPIKKLDEALIGVKKVTEATDEQMDHFAKTSYDVGSSLGVTADEYILAVEKWVTAGKSFTESQELAQVSMVGAFVGSIEPDMMVKYMSVPLNAFKQEGLEANDVINVMNETANNHAIEMDDLGKAYMRSATTAKNAGASYGELTGMITAAQEATRKGGERIGTGLKTIGINITSIQSQWKKIDQVNFDYLSDLGLELMNGDGSAKTMTEVIEQLVQVQDKLKPEEFSNAVKAMAGKEHAETLMAIVDQWDRVKQVAMEADEQLGQGEYGSAYKEHAKQAESIKFKLAELKNAWDKLMLTIGGGEDGIAKVLGVMTEGLGALNKLASNETLMSAMKYIFGAVGVSAGTNLFRRFFNVLGSGLGGFMTTGKQAKTLMADLFRPRVAPVIPAPVIATTPAVAKGGKGSKENRGKKNKESSKSNESSSTPSLIVTGGGASKNLEKDAKSAGKVNSKIGTTFKLIGKLASLIPVLGTGLLLLDFAGIPVFEKMGAGIDKLIGKTKDLGKESEAQRKKFETNNGIVNGELQKKDNELNGRNTPDVDEKTGKKTGKYSRKGGIRQQYSNAKNNDEGDGKKFINEEEFEKLAERINKFAEENGLVEVELKINDTAHIEQAIDALQEKIDKLQEKDVGDLGKQFQTDEGTISKAKEEQAVQLGKMEFYEKEKKHAKDIIDSYNERIQKGEELNDVDMNWLDDARSKYDTYTKKIDESSQAIQASTAIEDEAKASRDRNSMALAEYISKGGELTAMSQEQIFSALQPMIGQYDELTNKMNSVKGATAELNGEKMVEKESWDALISAYPELQGISLDQINQDEKKRQAVRDIVSAKQEENEKTAEVLSSAITASAQQVGLEKNVQVATGETAKVTGQLKTKIDGIKTAVNNVPKAKAIQFTLKVVEKISALGRSIWSRLTGGSSSATVTVNAGGGSSGGKGGRGGNQEMSISTGSNETNSSTTGSTATGLGGSSSASVSSGGGALVTTPTAVASVDMAKSTKSKAKPKATAKKDPNADARVNEDVWRYWDTETYGVERVDVSLKNLEHALKKNSENLYAQINLYKKQQHLLKEQNNYYRKLKRSKTIEMNETLNKLKKQGFSVSTKTGKVNNLSHAKTLKGEKAKTADELLGTWRQLYSEIRGLNETIKGNTQEIEDLTQEIKETEIAREIKIFGGLIKRIEGRLKKVANSDSLVAQRLSLVDTGNTEQGLLETQKAMNASKQNVGELILDFNKLSKATIKYGENGEELQGQLESIASEILAQSDAILEYKTSLNDMRIDRIARDFENFNNVLAENASRVSNNIENLKEGLLSGTTVADLQSSTMMSLELKRSNQYKTIAQERIDLEKKVQDALIAFAKKNIDREKKVANAQLEINAEKYNTMLNMEKQYQEKKISSSSGIKGESGSNITSDIEAVFTDYTFVNKLEKFFDVIEEKQAKLTEKYKKDTASALSDAMKDAITDQYILDSLKNQEEYFGTTIDAHRQAILEWQNELRNPELNDSQRASIKQSITDSERAIIDSQNSIKDTIRERFEYEFHMIDKAINKYHEYRSELDYALEIMDMLGGDNYSQRGTLMDQMLSSEKLLNSELAKTIGSLQTKLGLYERGSFEWNIINDELKEYKELLKDSNKELLNMNSLILSNSFGGTISGLEKKLFNGKSLREQERQEGLWMEGLEREYALEETYQRLADLGTQIHDQKMEQLSKQEKLSKFEMEHLNKQLDVLELQQKIENLSKERNIQTLKQKEDGTWDWVYESDPEELKNAKDELNDKEVELQNLEKEARKNYLAGLEEILSNAENGDYETVDQFKDAVADLGKAFETILKGLPNLEGYVTEDLIEAYTKYLKDNQGVVNGTSTTSKYISASPADAVRSADIVNDIRGDIEKAFNDKFLNIPSFNKVAERLEDKSITITLGKIEFPNIKNADGIEEAILSLPQIALQKSKGK